MNGRTGATGPWTKDADPHGVWVGESLIRVFPTENAALAFAVRNVKAADVTPVVWKLDPGYTAGGHWVKAEETR